MFFISLIAPRRAFGPMFAHPVIAGIRPEDWVTIFAVAWGVIGGVAVAESKSLVGIVAAFLIFTVPACLAILLAPAVVLILRSLA